MLVTRKNVESVCNRLALMARLAVDTETTGLWCFKDDRLFSIVIAGEDEAYYFPFGGSLPEGEEALGADELGIIRALFSSAPRLYYLHNAKFDLHFLEKEGICLHSDSVVHCTMVGSRLLDSTLPSLSLDAVAQKFLGEEKDDGVMAYIQEHALWDWEKTPGVQRRRKRLYFDRVPLSVMQPYAEKDALLTYRLGVYQEKEIALLDELAYPKWPSLRKVLDNERRLTRTCADMERRGVRVDLDYVERAIAYEEKRYVEATKAYEAETGQVYKASTKAFSEVFAEKGVDLDSLERTPTGSPRFDRKSLQRLGGSAAEHILSAKNAKSRLNFYVGFREFTSRDGLLHTDLKQAGTSTGRFSSAQPNLQNLTKADPSDPMPIRRAIIPASPDYCLVMLDYQQQEYRLMLDYAGELEVIEKILSGLDVHQATADIVGVTRQQAKTLNFALLYGAGVSKIAGMLELGRYEAGEIVERFFSALPKVEAFIERVKHAANNRRFLFNWFGRRVYYHGEASRYTYAAPNHIIQGGCADIVKIAMNRCAEFLEGRKSYMSLVIHDELVFNVHRNELAIVEELGHIMEDVYPYRYLPMGVDYSYSWTSLADKLKGLPQDVGAEALAQPAPLE